MHYPQLSRLCARAIMRRATGALATLAGCSARGETHARTAAAPDCVCIAALRGPPSRRERRCRAEHYRYRWVSTDGQLS